MPQIFEAIELIRGCGLALVGFTSQTKSGPFAKGSVQGSPVTCCCGCVPERLAS